MILRKTFDIIPDTPQKTRTHSTFPPFQFILSRHPCRRQTEIGQSPGRLSKHLHTQPFAAPFPMPTVITPNTSPLSALAARKKPTPAEINALIAAMKAELKGANQLGYYQRMEQNHDARYCWWSGQSVDGRKWSKDTGRRNRTLPGEVPPEEVFPFEGASDARVRLIDTVIRERCNFMRLALQRRQERIGPRNLSPDSAPQQKAALWSQVMSYFEDITRREYRRACARWASPQKSAWLNGRMCPLSSRPATRTW